MSVTIPEQSYPLLWPTSWPRAKIRTYAPFFSKSRSEGGYSQKKKKSMSSARDLINGELYRLGASKMLISTNVAARLDGLPYANQKPPLDPGDAVYFLLKGKPIVLACDKWNRVEDNVYAIGRHIEALRAQERWGVGRIEQAFSGYMALPAPMNLRPWWDVLDVTEDCTYEQARDSYIRMAKVFHPDVGGDGETMGEINTAWENARLSRSWN